MSGRSLDVFLFVFLLNFLFLLATLYTSRRSLIVDVACVVIVCTVSSMTGDSSRDIHCGYDPIVDKEMHGLLVDVQGHSEISALDAMLGNMLVLETLSGHMSVCCIPEFMEQFEWRLPLVQSDVRRCAVRIGCLRRPVVERGGVL